jgi:hypothetical protein
MDMGPLIATVVDTEALAKTVVASLVSAVGVTLVFSIAILGAARFLELNRSGRTAAAVAYGTLALLALAACAAALVVGIIVMTTK